jgi:NAD(P)-dependent dehydrogenase (short-subunit alcohol dehydrogenase family)|tara:strand:+ start:6007 stop:6837 length:831 start_codon:yes stop_codon:yes gene_type:complete
MSRTIVITGASDGIGAAAARQLHKDGHRVVVVGRSPQKTEAVARETGAEYFLADFSRLDDVRKLAYDLNSRCDRIDVLANNAGGVFGDRTKTVDGFEQTIQINHLAPFLLTQLLMGKLVDSNASVIQTSSSGARISGKLDINDLDQDKTYSPIRAYGTAKLANILFTKELHRRYHTKGVSAAAFHPGNVATSFGSRTTSKLMKFITSFPLTRATFVSAETGAQQLVWLAEGKAGMDWVSGTYYEKFQPARRNNPQALDADLALKLWERSTQILGME